MKVHASVVSALLAVSQLASAEPVFMPQAASVLKARQYEAGVGGMFGYQLSAIEGSAGTTYKNRVWHMPVLFRAGITDRVESRLVIPITRAVDSSEGLASSREADTGLGNVQLGAKWNFLEGRIPLAAGLDLDLPTANSKNNPAALGWRYSTQIQQGFNTHIYVVSDVPLLENRLRGHVSLGYMNTASYRTSGNTRFNPSDLMTFGASLDLSLDDKIKGLAVAAECVGNTAVSHSKYGSTTNHGDRGSVVEAGPSLRYGHGAWNTWTGLLIDAGDATYRAYNYRVSFGAAYRFGGAQ